MKGKDGGYLRTRQQGGRTTEREPKGSYSLGQTLGPTRQSPKIHHQIRGCSSPTLGSKKQRALCWYRHVQARTGRIGLAKFPYNAKCQEYYPLSVGARLGKRPLGTWLSTIQKKLSATSTSGRVLLPLSNLLPPHLNSRACQLMLWQFYQPG